MHVLIHNNSSIYSTVFIETVCLWLEKKMFKFNFNCDVEGESISHHNEKSDSVVKSDETKETVEKSNVVSKYDECKEITPTDKQLDTDYSCPPFELNTLILKNEQKIHYVSIGDIISELIENADEITCAENNHSDLVAGVYEGNQTSRFGQILHQNLL